MSKTCYSLASMRKQMSKTCYSLVFHSYSASDRCNCFHIPCIKSKTLSFRKDLYMILSLEFLGYETMQYKMRSRFC